MGVNIITPIGRFSFVNVFTPRKATEEGKKDKYEVSLLLAKDMSEDDAKSWKQMKGLAIAAAKEKWPKYFEKYSTKEAIAKLKLGMPFKDGDDEEYEGYEGHWFIRTSSIRKPGLVDAKRQAIIDADALYSGCYGRLDVDAYAYETKGNRGVTFGLDNVQKARDGERLGGGGGRAAADAFGALDSDDGADDPDNYDDPLDAGDDGDEDWDI